MELWESRESSACRWTCEGLCSPYIAKFMFAVWGNRRWSHRDFVVLVMRVWYFDLRLGPKMLFQGDAPEGSDTFQWPVIERDRVGGLRLIIWDKVKVPLCHYRVMHRKRVTSELHDSYFRLMTIKHSISKIEWVSNDYITQLSSTSQLSWSSRTVGGKMW